jgi:hypothetical protein
MDSYLNKRSCQGLQSLPEICKCGTSAAILQRTVSLRLNIEEKLLTLFGMTIHSRVAQPRSAACTLQNAHRQECLCYSEAGF